MTKKLTKPTNAVSTVALMIKEFYNKQYDFSCGGCRYYIYVHDYLNYRTDKMECILEIPKLYGDAKDDKETIPAIKKHLTVVKKWFNDKNNVHPETGLALLSPQDIEEWIRTCKYRNARMCSIDSYRMISNRNYHWIGRDPWIDASNGEYTISNKDNLVVIRELFKDVKA
jgi:hypothetical protein